MSTATVYFNGGMESVKGWLSPTTARIMHDLALHQTKRGIHGDVAEIGIYHGKSFFPLATALAEGEKAIAIDVFEDQHKNPDGSGADSAGDNSLQTFLRHKDQFAPDALIEVIKESSFDLARVGFVEQMRGRIRFFSIDGSHTREATLNDILIAEKTLCDGGLVTVDDILSPHWLGVISGVCDYLAGGRLRRYLTGRGRLRPLALIPNKLILSDGSPWAAEWTAFLLAEYGSALAKRGVELFGHPIDVFEERR
jgi:hypothetical protein